MSTDTVTVALVLRAQAGDRAALERILDRYYDRVRRAVGIRMGQRVRTWTDSVDIMSRTLMKALAKFDTFEMRDESSLLRWLVTIAEGMIGDAVDERNAAKRNPIHEVRIDAPAGDGAPFRAPMPDPATTITRQLGRSEESELVDRAIENLAAEDRDLLLQFYYLDMTWEDIAMHQGLVTATANDVTRKQAGDKVRKRADGARARLAIELQRLRRHDSPGI